MLPRGHKCQFVTQIPKIFQLRRRFPKTLNPNDSKLFVLPLPNVSKYTAFSNFTALVKTWEDYTANAQIIPQSTCIGKLIPPDTLLKGAYKIEGRQYGATCQSDWSPTPN